MDATDTFEDWDLDAEPAPAPRRRGPWLLAVGAIPWVVLTVVLLRPTAGGTASASGGASPQVSGVVDDPAPGATPGEPTVPAEVATVTAAATGAVPTVAEAGAVAVVVARGHLTGVGPVLAVAGAAPAPDRYVEHLAVESVVHPGPGAVVVTVLAVVLTIEDDRYDAVEVIRLAVPLTFDRTGASPAGPPWRLPPPDLGDRPLTVGEPIDDPVLLTEAGAAVTAAGYAVDDVVGLAATVSWPLVATVDATAPGEAAPRRHHLWLRSHLGELVVAGADLERQDLP